MSIFNRYNKTNFEAGYLREEGVVLGGKNTLKASKKFVAPRKVDTRDMCLVSSNQGQTPHCAGYSTAGFIEVRNWKRLHYPEQVDGDAIYKKAKEFDTYTGDGTSLSCATKAAIELGLIKGKQKYISPERKEVKFAIHEFGTCIAGFMITDEWNYVHKKTGYIRVLPRPNKRGGHAVLIVGYNKHGVFIQNSWGKKWGLYGFALLPWALFDKQMMSGMIIK